ncbi:MAG: L-seryl-tRNA(Sec) selenium transferase [Thermoguttaceae bacterium]|jgi:L-seryl-tRNA(Ser) seleniumtransferase|nr:L-seryl-tRNA(Sec) selenium transferase [Thermoguttaceae bacterium]
MTPEQQAALRNIPSIEVLLHDPLLASHGAAVPRPVLVDLIRESVEEVRSRVLSDAPGMPGPADADAIRREIVARVAQRAEAMARPYYRKVINATGIILHTALGRAVLPAKAIRQIVDELSGYSLLQADLETGRRSKRDLRIEALLKRLTGAPAATVVNNNAAATSIVLNTVAKGREVIVSRGQLVEIGGSFRLPDVIAASGAILVEVGTTNKTHPRDYERAITGNTAAILRVHPSNYRIAGFTSEVSLGELVEIAHARGILVIDDVGAGPLIDFARFGFEPEPTLQASVAAGADLITASADKLIGGPQGGIILGREDLIQAIRKNPLARVVRVDKITLAALEATLSLFLDEALALDQVPTLRMLRRGLADLDAQAKRIASALRRETAATVRVIDGCSQMGSGSLPTQDLPTRLVAIEASIDPGELAARLRQQSPPVFARVHKNQLLLDPRTVLEGEEELLVRACLAALAGSR